jgi:hypothetical protein
MRDTPVPWLPQSLTSDPFERTVTGRSSNQNPPFLTGPKLEQPCDPTAKQLALRAPTKTPDAG